jgi:hypothetical protein
MTDETADSDGTTGGKESIPTPALSSMLWGAWSSLKTVYYANSISWRFLKSGTLVFFGFFLWAGSNILYSYNPDLTVLQYPMAYGFILIVYGPFHHLVVLPLAFRWRRQSGTKQRVGRRLPNAMLVVFLVGVLILGTSPVGAMMVDFDSALESSGADISPDLLCTKSPTEAGTEIHCHLTESEGIDRVVIQSGNSQLLVDDTPPYEFTINERELESVTGEKQFTVVLQDEDGTMIRRYTRRLSMIEEG